MLQRSHEFKKMNTDSQAPRQHAAALTTQPR
jgi:hypothetical protein